MLTTTVSSRYNVAIPRSTRQQLNLRPGQKLEVVVLDGVMLLAPVLPIEALRGFAKGINIDDYRDEEDRF